MKEQQPHSWTYSTALPWLLFVICVFALIGEHLLLNKMQAEQGDEQIRRVWACEFFSLSFSTVNFCTYQGLCRESRDWKCPVQPWAGPPTPPWPLCPTQEVSCCRFFRNGGHASFGKLQEHSMGQRMSTTPSKEGNYHHSSLLFPVHAVLSQLLKNHSPQQVRKVWGLQ